MCETYLQSTTNGTNEDYAAITGFLNYGYNKIGEFIQRDNGRQSSRHIRYEGLKSQTVFPSLTRALEGQVQGGLRAGVANIIGTGEEKRGKEGKD